MDARKRAIQNAPQVLFRNEPPLELQGVPKLANERNDEVGYVTFGSSVNIWLSQFSFLIVHSVISKALNATTAAGDYFPYSDVSGLLSLSHQGI